MKRKKNIMKIAATMFALAFAMVFALAGSVGVFAKEENFNDGVYTYKGTGYSTTAWTSGTELVAKIDTYYYQNLSDIEYCAADVYFYKRDSGGNRVNATVKGYAVAQFEKNGEIYATSGRCYDDDHGNAEAWSDGVSIWYFATPHYYGNATKEK